MKVLVIHNRYVEAGGEDVAVRSEIQILRDAGHKVITYERSNEEIKGFSLFKKISFLISGIGYSKNAYKEITDIIQREKPDIAHIANIFFVISPSVYYALRDNGVPVVQTIHNYRPFCLNGLFYRKGRICEECSVNNFFPAIINRCGKGSFLLTFFLARALRGHFRKRTFYDKVDVYIAPTEYCKNKFIKAGFSEDKIFIKPNAFKGSVKPRENFRNYALFLGRLIDYKGLSILISAYKKLEDYHLKIIGGGPLFNEIKRAASTSNSIEVLGRLPHEEAIEYLKNAAFLIFPSECYETFGIVVIEAFACGVPVLARDIGGIRELVSDGETGILFKYKDIDDLTEKIEYLTGNKDLLVKMKKNARKTYEEKYTVQKNYEALMNIYKKAIENYKKQGRIYAEEIARQTGGDNEN